MNLLLVMRNKWNDLMMLSNVCIKTLFGTYSISGYTDNKDVHDTYRLRLYPEGNDFISVYVVCYPTCIKSDELICISKHADKQGFVYDGVNQFVDSNVYKLSSGKDGRGGTEKFRHILSQKIYTTNYKYIKHKDNINT